MGITQFERPSLLLLCNDGKIPLGPRFYLVLADDKLPIGRPIQRLKPGLMGDLIPVAEVFPAPAGPLRAFSIEEFCRLTGMSSRTFSRLWRSGSLVARKIGGRTVVTYEDAMAFLRNLPEANAIDRLLVVPKDSLGEVS